MKVKIKYLLSEEPEYGLISYDDLKGFVATEYQGEEHFSANNMVVLERRGGLWAFDDLENSEGENDITELYKYNKEAEIELYKVQEVPSVKYVKVKS